LNKNEWSLGEMSRISTFVFGMLTGAALLGAAMSYHFVRTDKGVIMVPKVTKGLTDPYVDIRDFSLQDWQEHRSLAAALVQAKKGEVLADNSLASFRSSIEGVIQGLFGPSS
jgi:hypothetical protein